MVSSFLAMKLSRILLDAPKLDLSCVSLLAIGDIGWNGRAAYYLSLERHFVTIKLTPNMDSQVRCIPHPMFRE